MSKLSIGSLFQSGMVLQQNEVNCIYGKAEPSQKISFAFRNIIKTVKCDKNGCWKILFNPQNAGGPDIIIVESECNEKITLTDVYTGEVWLMSGQSNMQLTMDRLRFSFPKEFSLPENNSLRFFTVPISYSFDGEKSELSGGKWQAASPESIDSISGCSYFFAKKLQKELNVPVGIINASQGGSPIASWLDEKTVRKYPDYLKRLEECKDKSYVEKTLKDNAAQNEAWNKKCYEEDEGNRQKWEEKDFSFAKKWSNFNIPDSMGGLEKSGTVWLKKEFVLTEKEALIFNSTKTRLWLGTIFYSDTVWVNGKMCGSTGYEFPPRRYEVPFGTLVAGKNCITIRAVYKNGRLSFEKEKPYFIFTDNVNVSPVKPGNIVGTKDNAQIGKDAAVVNLTGAWKYKEGSSLENSPGCCFFEWEPTSLYNSMLAPCFNYAVKGFVWYQGESDAGKSNDYEKQLSEMIDVWRKKFLFCKGTKAPFIIVQLPNFGQKDDVKNDMHWCELRDCEKSVSKKNKNCGLAVTIDCGDWNDLHPEDKETVGSRISNEAMRLCYAKKTLTSTEVTSVEVKKVVHSKEGVIIEFTQEIKHSENDMPVIIGVLEDGAKQKKICRLSVRAVAHNKLIVFIPPDEVKKDVRVVEVRYAWCDSPTNANLYNKKGNLPVVPFRAFLS